MSVTRQVTVVLKGRNEAFGETAQGIPPVEIKLERRGDRVHMRRKWEGREDSFSLSDLRDALEALEAA